MAFNGTEWKPTPQQALFASLPWTIKEAFFGGAAGGGKSDLLLVLPLLLRLHENPRFKQLFTRRTFAELKNEIVPRSREIYRKFGATFNGSDMAWTFPRDDQYGSGRKNEGAIIFFGHCEHDKDVVQYDSMEINLFTPDELTSFTEWMYLYIGLTRVRTSDPSLPAIIRGAGMPGGIGHTFVKKRFIDPYEKGGVVVVGKAGVKRFYVHSSFDDNPYIDPGYRQSIEALPEAEKRAKKGDWNAFQGQVFDEFREFHYPDEPENALHVYDEASIPDWWPRIVVGDWGMRAMTWIGFGAVSPKGRLYIEDERAFKNKKISEWAPEVRELIKNKNVKLVKFCRSAGNDTGQEHTIQEQIATELDWDIELTQNKPGSRIAGKMLLHEYLRWKPKVKLRSDETLEYDEFFAAKLLRLKGQKAYEDYLNLFVPEEEEVLPRILINRKCVVLIEAIKACSYDKKKIEDIAEFNGDDPIDGIRYMVDAADGYIKTAVGEMEKMHRQEEINRRFDMTRDFTALHMQMNKMEAESRITGIRRYKRH